MTSVFKEPEKRLYRVYLLHLKKHKRIACTVWAVNETDAITQAVRDNDPCCAFDSCVCIWPKK